MRAPLEAAIPPGKVIAGKYRIERSVGGGGMGCVFEATHLQLEQRVAIKILLPELALNEQLVARFLREAKAAARIRGDHCGRVLDVGRLDGGLPYMVLEFLEGTDLGHLLAMEGALPVRRAVDYVVQVCDALEQAHGFGIVHRDIKPSNMFVTSSSGRACVKVIDFGIAKQVDDVSGAGAMTRTSESFGSPLYMSPEQIRAARDVDARADVWALGVVLHELLAGTPPFVAPSVLALASVILNDPPASIRAHRADVPAAVEAAVLRCLQKVPERRFSSVVDLAEALRAFASPEEQALVDVMRARSSAEPRAIVSGSSPSLPPEVVGADTTIAVGSAPDRGDASGALDATLVQTSAPVASPVTGPGRTSPTRSARSLKVAAAVVALGVVCAMAVLIVPYAARHARTTPDADARPQPAAAGVPAASSPPAIEAASVPAPSSTGAGTSEPDPAVSASAAPARVVRLTRHGDAKPVPTASSASSALTAPKPASASNAPEPSSTARAPSPSPSSARHISRHGD